ncbi:radical SAM protein [bacterium]|nr:MAG: radical SAM protein [bacterium]
MANLGLQSLYRIISALPGAVCDLHFADRPRGLLTGQSIASSSIIAFSLSFEGDYPAIPEILRQAGIAPLAADRGEDSPLLLAGGMAATLNPEPLAEIFDIFYLGEAEGPFALLHEFLSENIGLERSLLLGRLAAASLPGVYVPSAYRVAADYSREPLHGAPEKVAMQRAPEGWEPAHTVIAGGEDDPFGGARLLEISRGCPHGCRFCATGYLARPARFIPFEKLLPYIEKYAGKGERIGLVGAAVSNHPEFARIAREILAAGGGFTVSSFRAETLDDEMLGLLREGGLKTLTLAIEAGTEQLRRRAGKTLDEEALLRAAQLASRHRVSRLKVYAMVGLPGEEDSDVEELARLAGRVKTALGRGNVTLSAAPFVPKPHTPFQWEKMEDEEVLRRRIRLLKRISGPISGLTVDAESPKWSLVQGLLSRAGREAGKWLAGGGEGVQWPRILRTPEAAGILGARDPDALLPWDFISETPRRELLLEERRRSGLILPPMPCPSESCRFCGICRGD